MVPSSTFFHLPEEKRETILRHAREEFSRAPYPDVSINRIVRGAGIPRGSFYMYFTDKADLFHYLLAEYGRRIVARLEALLREHQGDLFAVGPAFFDYIQADYRRPESSAGYQLAAAILRLNPEMRPAALLTCDGPPLLRRLEACIDRDRLVLDGPDDLEDILRILVSVTAPAIREGILADDPVPARTRYLNILQILARGMATEPTPVLSHQ